MSVTYVTPMYFSYFSTTSLRESDWVNTMLSSALTLFFYIYIYTRYTYNSSVSTVCVYVVYNVTRYFPSSFPSTTFLFYTYSLYIYNSSVSIAVYIVKIL